MTDESRPRWAAVVVNHDAGDLLMGCVLSLVADDALGSPEVVVVDNASSDDSADALEGAIPGVRVVRAPGNVGYATAANLGTAATVADVVAVLNPDTVVELGTGPAMVAELQADSALGAVGPRIRNPDGSVYPSARSQPGMIDAVGHGLLGWFWPTNPCTRRYRQLDSDPNVARCVDWLSGSAIWLRRSALDDIGGWDERYFMYMEDVDLGARLRAAGWRLRYSPAGEVEHVQGASTDRHPYRMIREHHRSMWRFATDRYRGSAALLLPTIAVYLALRCGLMWLDHALRAATRRRISNGTR